MNEIEYRLATITDVPDLISLRRAFLLEVDGTEKEGEALATAMHAYFTRAIPTAEYIGFLALADNKIIGNAGLVWHHYPPSGVTLTGTRAHILNVYILPAWRHKGIATHLLQRAIAHAKSNNCQRITLHAVENARALYEHLGFKPTNSEMRLE